MKNSFVIVRATTYLCVLATFLLYFHFDFTGWIKIVPIEAWAPVGIANNFYSIFNLLKNELWLTYFFTAGIFLTSIFCILGRFLKISSLVLLILFSIVFGLKNSFGHAFRSEGILVTIQIIFVAHFYGLFDKRNAIFALKLFWVSIFFLGGLNKLKHSGLDWITENYTFDYLMANQITRATILSENGMNEWISSALIYPKAIFIVGILILLFELTYPLIFLKKFKNIYLLATIFFQSMVYVFFGVNFFYYFCLIPIWLVDRTES